LAAEQSESDKNNKMTFFVIEFTQIHSVLRICTFV